MTYPHITNKLERRITACALNTFRQFEPIKSTAKYIVFLSMSEDLVFDECHINREEWKLEKIVYDVWKGKKIIKKTINLSPANH